VEAFSRRSLAWIRPCAGCFTLRTTCSLTPQTPLSLPPRCSSQTAALLASPDGLKVTGGGAFAALKRFTLFALVTGVAALFGVVVSSRASIERLNGEDYYTVDRCIIYTYYPKGLDTRDALQASIWKKSWKQAGWKPVVLDERHAAIHPRYSELRQKYANIPSEGAATVQDKTSSYMRHLAIAAVGGGWLSEPDVFNVNMPPPPKCDWIPNGGKVTSHDIFIPGLVSGDARNYEDLAVAFADAPASDVAHATGQTALSDVVFFSYFYQYAGIITTRKTGQNNPEMIREPPCDKKGVEYAPMIFHMSPHMMKMVGAVGVKNQPDRTVGAVMDEYYERLMSAKTACKPLEYESTHDYQKLFFPEQGEVTKLQASYNQEYLCEVAPEEAFCKLTPEQISDGFEGIVDKYGKKVKMPKGSSAAKAKKALLRKVEEAKGQGPTLKAVTVDKSQRLLTKYVDAALGKS